MISYTYYVLRNTFYVVQARSLTSATLTQFSNQQISKFFLLDYPIVIFDGICNYCNRMVNFAIRNDPHAKLRFVASQSEKGQELLRKLSITASLESLIFVEGDRISHYSTAAIRIARYLRWPARMLYAFIIFPRFIRDPFYKWIARNRYKWFGRRESCRVPTPEERGRFL